MRLKKLLSLLLTFLLLSVFLFSCGKDNAEKSAVDTTNNTIEKSAVDTTNNTIENCAKTFINALIESNEENLNKVNKSQTEAFSTKSLLAEMSPKLKEYKISDFNFSVNEAQGLVIAKSSNEKANLKLSIKNIKDKYYFYYLENLNKVKENETMSGCAKMFIKALIGADKNTIDMLNKTKETAGTKDSFISIIAPNFKNFNIDNFTFEPHESEGYVYTYSSDKQMILYLKFKKLDNEYYLSDFEQIMD